GRHDWYSNSARTGGGRSASFSHAGGRSSVIAWQASRPAAVRGAKAASRLAESLPPSGSSGLSSPAARPRRAAASEASRARIRLRLPWIVLISPLWARVGKGWVRLQEGWVLVLKRWWKSAKAVAKAG